MLHYEKTPIQSLYPGRRTDPVPGANEKCHGRHFPQTMYDLHGERHKWHRLYYERYQLRLFCWRTPLLKEKGALLPDRPLHFSHVTRRQAVRLQEIFNFTA